MGKTRIKSRDFQERIKAIEVKAKKEVKELKEEMNMVKAIEKKLGGGVEVDMFSGSFVSINRNGQKEQYVLHDEFSRISQFLYEFIEYEVWEYSDKNDSLTQEEYFWDMIKNNQIGEVMGNGYDEIKFYVGEKPFYLYHTL